MILKLTRRGAFAAALMLALSSPVAAQKTEIGQLIINQPWTRATPARNGAAYLDVKNVGKTDDRLLGATMPGAARVEIHGMSTTGGIMRMREQAQGIAIPAGRSVRLAPGGMHLMLIGLKQPLVQGGRVPLTLRFAKAGETVVSLKVSAAGSLAAGRDEHAGH